MDQKATSRHRMPAGTALTDPILGKAIPRRAILTAGGLVAALALCLAAAACNGGPASNLPDGTVRRDGGGQDSGEQCDARPPGDRAPQGDRAGVDGAGGDRARADGAPGDRAPAGKPLYFIAVHHEPVFTAEDYVALEDLVATADRYAIKLTLMFTAQWADFIAGDPTRAAALEAWKRQGHEIAGHHHDVYHPQTWDGYSALSEADAIAYRRQHGLKPGTYIGDLHAYMAEVHKLNPALNSGCGGDEQEKTALPDEIIYDACSGYTNYGNPVPATRDIEAKRGRNEFVLVAKVNAIERRWLGHFLVQSPENVAPAETEMDSMQGGAFGVVVHAKPTQVPAMKSFIEYLHRSDPTGGRSSTLSAIIRSGALPERQVVFP